MNYTRLRNIALLIITAFAFIGCKAKQESPGANNAAPQQVQGVKSISGEGAAGAAKVSPQDLADARALALRVLAQMEAGDFSAIYKDSSAGFKKIGPEAAFVAKFQQTRQKTGVLKKPKELSMAARPDAGIVLVYRVENERFNTDMRLSFARAQGGKMELAGLNQHDEPRK